ncbi:MAG TPA: hypothetical protein VIK91_05660 [Nannocystis sp.]
MKKLLFITTLAAFTAGFASPALANYFWPGRVIIGTGIIGGGGGTTASTMSDGCVVKPTIECECFPGMPVLDACRVSVEVPDCLTPDTVYDALIQEEEVVIADGTMTLGGLHCGDWSDQTAIISLPYLEGALKK